jgi:hypothetical protein
MVLKNEDGYRVIRKVFGHHFTLDHLTRMYDAMVGDESVEDIAQYIRDEIIIHEKSVEKAISRDRKDNALYGGLEECDVSKARNKLGGWCRAKPQWNDVGLIATDEEKNKILRRYFSATQCELCGKALAKNSRDRCMDHHHKTGKFRMVCCQSCNKPANNPFDYDSSYDNEEYGLYVNQGLDFSKIKWDNIYIWVDRGKLSEEHFNISKSRASKPMSHERACYIVKEIFERWIIPSCGLIPLS